MRESYSQPIPIQDTGIQEVGGIIYTPYSFIHYPALLGAHTIASRYRLQHDELATAKWLSSLTIPNADGKLPLKDHFYSFSTHGPDHAHQRPEQLTATEGLLVYTSAKLENLLRLQAVRESEGTDNGISMLLSGELAQLSNAYRSRYKADQTKPYLLDLAHSLAMYALRFHHPDHSGYSQTLGHWLHLDVSVDPRNSDQFDRFEETLKLALALKEIGYGPQDGYVKLLVRDLKELYILRGDDNKAQEVHDHFKDIPSITGEPEIWFQEQQELNRKRREQEKTTTPKHRRKRRR